MVLQRSASAWFVWVSSGCWVSQGDQCTSGWCGCLQWCPDTRPWGAGRAGIGTSAT